MSIRQGHGKERGKWHVEVVADEIPAGVAVQKRQGFAKDTSSALQRLRGKQGGRFRAAVRKAEALARECHVAPHPQIAGYLKEGREAAKIIMYSMAAQVGGGTCPPHVGTIILNACATWAVSRYYRNEAAATMDQKLFQFAARLDQQARQDMVAAQAMCAIAAKSAHAAQMSPAALGQLFSTDPSAPEEPQAELPTLPEEPEETPPES